ncbi:MAG: hypothetical protein ABIS03_07015, partial [Gemmatimonadaceae bacterium]
MRPGKRVPSSRRRNPGTVRASVKLIDYRFVAGGGVVAGAGAGVVARGAGSRGTTGAAVLGDVPVPGMVVSGGAAAGA